jgi:hypothetical protein
MRKILILICLLSTAAYGDQSMRRCTLLPITDSVEGAVGFKVFQEVETELKKVYWCNYVSNSGLINIFTRYRENLSQHLKTKEVLKVVAEKLKAGTIIRINLVHDIDSVEVQLDIYGDNGEDLYFSEKKLLKNDDTISISEVIKAWLETYSKLIPYDARVIGVLGDQVTLDSGNGYPITEGQEFQVRRYTGKKIHPLLKKIVSWESEIVAEGEISRVSEGQSLGVVKIYKAAKKLQVGDWIELREVKKSEPKISLDEKKIEPGNLGMASFHLVVANSVADSSTPKGSKRVDGPLFGFDIRAEAWITRQYFASLQIARTLGKLKESAGNVEQGSSAASFGLFKITGGYKYLPLGFFYGPQLDFYGGYANYLFDLDYSLQDGFGRSNISGILFGVSGNFPLNREYRIHARAELIPFPSYEESDAIYGGTDSASLVELEFGGRYTLNPRMTLDASLGALKAKANFGGEYREISYQENLKFKFGTTLSF